jgi:hypothetical protein
LWLFLALVVLHPHILSHFLDDYKYRDLDPSIDLDYIDQEMVDLIDMTKLDYNLDGVDSSSILVEGEGHMDVDLVLDKMLP